MNPKDIAWNAEEDFVFVLDDKQTRNNSLRLGQK